MAQLELTNVINISVSAAQAGIGEYNTSNLAIFTKDSANESFGDDGFKIYLSPSEVATDFGTTSSAYKMANAVFSQQPNILAGGGSLIVILVEQDLPAVTAVQHIAFSSVPTTGTYKLHHGTDTSSLAADADDTTVQTALRALSGFSTVDVVGDTDAGFDVTFTGVTGPVTLLTVTQDSLQDTDGEDITVTTTTVGQAAGSETADAAITRTQDLVQYFGLMFSYIPNEQETLDAAAVVQALNKIAFWVSKTEADVNSGGLIDELRTGGFSQSRGLFYENDDSEIASLIMMASYAGRGLSTNFTGSNTTQTMHLKDLIGVQPDGAMTQSLLNKCLTAGADTYVSLQGVPKVFCSGANTFFDDVYNLQWFVGALQVAGFNFLAQSSTKVPQTESGMDGLKGAYRGVAEQAVANQYAAPGSWNSSTSFGNQADFLANIAQRGYYIFSTPISQQSQADRADRKAPLVQIALKEAGAIQSSSVIVYVNQ